LGGGEVGCAEGLGADGPHRCNPGKVCADVPFVGEVEPLTGADGFFDGFAGFESEESRIANEDRGVGLLQHGDGIGCGWDESGVSVEEFSEEDFSVG